jgi:hypothetical protein
MEQVERACDYKNTDNRLQKRLPIQARKMGKMELMCKFFKHAILHDTKLYRLICSVIYIKPL